jgi:transcriptional regulator with XRE-family HTH domain
MPPSKRPRKDETFDQAFRTVLRELREKRGWTQAELGAAAGYGQNYVSPIETGRQTPRINVLIDLVQALGVRPDRYMREVVKRMESKPPVKRRRP